MNRLEQVFRSWRYRRATAAGIGARAVQQGRAQAELAVSTRGEPWTPPKPQRRDLTPDQIAAEHALEDAGVAAWDRLAAAYAEERRRFLALPGATVELADAFRLFGPDSLDGDVMAEAWEGYREQEGREAVALAEFLLTRIGEDEVLARADADSPARALAECAARRRIVSRTGGWADADEDVQRAMHHIRLALAQPYADHPDFDPAWRL